MSALPFIKLLFERRLNVSASTKMNPDNLLAMALDAFVRADYHPWNGIEVKIREALIDRNWNHKIALLKSLGPKLEQSDYENVRALGRTIQDFTDSK